MRAHFCADLLGILCINAVACAPQIHDSLAGAHIFAWFSYFNISILSKPDIANALARTALLYALSQTVHCLATPFTARFLLVGTRRVLIFGVLFAATAFVSLGATFEGFWSTAYIGAAIAVYAISIGLYRAIYWIPYEVEASVQRRTHISIFKEILIALAPLVAGLFIVSVEEGPALILYTGGNHTSLHNSNFVCGDIHESSWNYRETFVIFHRKSPHGDQSFLEGFPVRLILFWPLTVFLLSDGVAYSDHSFRTFIMAILMQVLYADYYAACINQVVFSIWFCDYGSSSLS